MPDESTVNLRVRKASRLSLGLGTQLQIALYLTLQILIEWKGSIVTASLGADDT